MHDLQLNLQYCQSVLDSLSVPYHAPVRTEINTRAYRRYGQCRKTPEGFVISISHALLEDRADIRALRTTLYHELLHTIDGCQNHQKLWKQYARLVSHQTGLNISTTSDFEKEYGITLSPPPGAKARPYLYTVECTACHRQWHFKRMCKSVAYPQRYRCRCGGKLRSGPYKAK